MSYVVLARKYRPRTFAQMAGQDHVVRALGNALRQQRLHHAYLFTGTRGIGKTTVSRILAKSLNCTGPDGQGGITAEPCGRCSACTEIDGDRFVDYIEMDAASNRGIDEVRDMIERAAYKPSVGRFKVFMIDEAHQLTKEAFNALLKTLEEPPDYLKFVLATTDPEKMLPTVLSRCLQFNLRPMAPETVRRHLATVLQSEGIDHDEGALHVLSKAARGSMRDALSLTDQAIAYGGGRFDEALVRGMLGLAGGDAAAHVLRALADRDGAGVLAAVEALRERGVSFDATLEQVATLVQQAAVEQAVPGSLPADDPDAVTASELATRFTPEEIQLLYSLALHGRAELGLMSDPSAAFTMVLLRYLAFPPVASAAGTAPRAAPLRAPSPAVHRAVAVPRPASGARPRPDEVPDGPEPPPVFDAFADGPAEGVTRHRPERMSTAAPARSAAAPTATTASRTAAAPSGPPPRTPDDPALGDRWNAWVRALIEGGKVSGLVRELAWQSVLLSIAEGPPETWTLCTGHEALRGAGLRDKLSAALSALLERPIVLDVQAGGTLDAPAQREAAERERRQRAAEQLIHQDPVVRELLDQFATARIVPGSIKPV